MDLQDTITKINELQKTENNCMPLLRRMQNKLRWVDPTYSQRKTFNKLQTKLIHSLLQESTCTIPYRIYTRHKSRVNLP